MRDDGATAVMGAVLMLSLMMMMVPSAVMLKSALTDEMNAHREAAERAAWCARHPETGPPTCVLRGPLPGYRCDTIGGDAWLCRPEGVDLPKGNLTLDANATSSPGGAPLMHADDLPASG